MQVLCYPFYPHQLGGHHTVVATRTCSGLKPSISPSNVALNSNPGTVLETARPEDSKDSIPYLPTVPCPLKTAPNWV